MRSSPWHRLAGGACDAGRGPGLRQGAARTHATHPAFFLPLLGGLVAERSAGQLKIPEVPILDSCAKSQRHAAPDGGARGRCMLTFRTWPLLYSTPSFKIRLLRGGGASSAPLSSERMSHGKHIRCAWNRAYECGGRSWSSPAPPPPSVASAAVAVLAREAQSRFRIAVAGWPEYPVGGEAAPWGEAGRAGSYVGDGGVPWASGLASAVVRRRQSARGACGG